MKYIKTYENIIKEIQIGDYVIMTTPPSFRDDLQNFIKNNIGEIIDLNSSKTELYVEYKYVPENLKIHFMSSNPYTDEKTVIRMSIYYINKISENIEDLEVDISANKYNL